MNTTTEINWIQEAEDYGNFLQLEGEDFCYPMTQEQAKQWCLEMLEHMIAINGTGDLFETERALAKLLNYDLED
jgi:hypothetical protein